MNTPKELMKINTWMKQYGVEASAQAMNRA
jgi:hypothetical protein